MISSKQEALSILGIKGDEASGDEVLRTFNKLLRRYPPQHFPERFARTKEAFDFLQSPDKRFLSILTERQIDLSLLAPHCKVEPQKPLSLPDKRELLSELLRNILSD